MIYKISDKNWKNLKPMEDSFGFSQDGNRIVVADGITRDPKGMPILPSMRNLIGMANFFINYPRPSPAKVAANLCSETFVKSSEKNSGEILKEANRIIKEFNSRYFQQNGDLDYLENDYPACVASGVVVEGEKMNWGFIADCGVAVFDKNGNRKFQTKNEGPNSNGSIDEDIIRRYKLKFSQPEGRRLIRSRYRNNPGNALAYGALTGEQTAEHYIQTGELKLSDGDLIAVYSDGVEDALKYPEFEKSIKRRDFKLMEDICRNSIRSEGTLVARLIE